MTVTARLAETTAFITGAGSGIGRAIARRLASEGAAVGIADIDLDGARETARTIIDAGGRAHAVRVDITSFEEVRQAVGAVRDTFGAVGVLVNNAGWDRIEPFVQNSTDLWEKIIAINLKGPIHCCRAVLDDMIAAGRGKIISISSDAARVGSTGEAVYSACKGGIIAFSKTLAREHARHQINVNVVCPGPTQTPLLAEITSGDQGAKVIEAMKRAVPMRRLGVPDDIAGAVAFFASPDSDFITGQVLSVSGGLTMAG
jgi:2-hydroxycyclohexanecarboxyl-CoA dehydrogenase